MVCSRHWGTNKHCRCCKWRLTFRLATAPTGSTGNPFDGQAVLTVDGILASWSGVFNAPEAGVYRFETVSDDATMVFIDGQTVVNNNAQQGMTRVGGDVTLTAGNHEISDHLPRR